VRFIVQLDADGCYSEQYCSIILRLLYNTEAISVADYVSACVELGDQ
jgi:hypothetical protein